MAADLDDRFLGTCHQGMPRAGAEAISQGCNEDQSLHLPPEYLRVVQYVHACLVLAEDLSPGSLSIFLVLPEKLLPSRLLCRILRIELVITHECPFGGAGGRTSRTWSTAW